MKLLFTFLLFLFFYNTHAATYYINPKGNDNYGNGSINNPWQTLHKATTSVTRPGDIIHVSAGIFTEYAECILAPGISIEGEGSSSVIKSSITADWKAVIVARSAEGTNGNQHIAHLQLDGQNLSTFWAIDIKGRSNFSIHHCIIKDFKDRGVIFDGRADNTPAPPVIFATGNSFYSNTVTNCAAYNTANGIYGRGCLNIGGQQDMLIYENVITQTSRPEGFNGWPIKYSNDGYLKGCKIYKNILTKLPYSGNAPGENGWDFAIELWNILGGVEIYSNTVQGAVDVVNNYKTSYPFSVWFHDNKVSQKKLNSHYESGIIFEATTEGVIIENNIFDNISGGMLFNAQENTVLNNILIRNNTLTNIGRNTGNGNNGSGINFNCGTLFGNVNKYSLNNLLIYNNTIAAAKGNAPFYGIEITGGRIATNIKIQNNTFKDFRITYLIANPAAVIDTLLIEKNILSGNGNGNDPFFISGTPANYIIRHNTKNNISSSLSPSFNFREQVLRPLYYDVKLISMLQYVAMLSGVIALLLYIKENVYAFAMMIINSGIYFFLNLELEKYAEAFINLYFIAMSIYGVAIWLKRNHRNHRIVRITAASKKEILSHLVFFAAAFVLLFAAIIFFKTYFLVNTLSIVLAIAHAATFTGLWLTVNKKAASWYYWIAGNAAFIFLYFSNYAILTSGYYTLLLLLCFVGLFRWKNKITAGRKYRSTI